MMKSSRLWINSLMDRINETQIVTSWFMENNHEYL